MSEENVAAARRFWERFSDGAAAGRADAGLGSAELHPDVEYVEDARWPGSGTYKGLPAIQARFEEYLDVLGGVGGGIAVTLLEALDCGEVVVLIFATKGASVQTGLPFEHDWAYVLTFGDGRIVRWRAYFDKDEALEAVRPRK